MTPEIIDYASMNPKEFWSLVDQKAAMAKKRVEQLFHMANTPEGLNYVHAVECLNSLFIDSHNRIRELNPSLSEVYPTKKILFNSLDLVKDLWIVDHTTSHISEPSILENLGNGNNSIEKSVHFLIPFKGLPYYLVPLLHGAKHESSRNHDSIAISTMNVGGLSQEKDKWNFWGGILPQNLVTEIPPMRLSSSYRGYFAFQPFTTEQIKNNITLKRIIYVALRRKIDISRFTQHSDWQDTSVDMGPLWPADRINEASLENIPAQEYDFVQRYDAAFSSENIAEANKFVIATSVSNPEFTIPEQPPLPPMNQIQLSLCKVGIKINITNRYDTVTKEALRKFQQLWNQTHLDNQLETAGIPNLKTCKCLEQGEKSNGNI